MERRPYFDSALQHARWLVDDAQDPAAQRIKLIVKSPALAEPLDVVESGDLALLAKKLPSVTSEDILFRPGELRP